MSDISGDERGRCVTPATLEGFRKPTASGRQVPPGRVLTMTTKRIWAGPTFTTDTAAVSTPHLDHGKSAAGAP
ncbi:hypothetical protein GCM10010532_084840 [Dactylosporangium siamense]